MADNGDEENENNIIGSSTGEKPGGVIYARVADISPTATDKAFVTATASAAVGEGLVFVAPDDSANVYVHEGSIIKYNLPPEEQRDKLEVTAELAEKRITAKANWTFRQLETDICRRRDDCRRWFFLLVASGMLTLIAAFVGGGLLLNGSIGLGVYAEFLAAVTGGLTTFFHGKDRELRKDLRNAEDHVQDMNNLLFSFDIASTIDDEAERTNAKCSIIRSALGVPDSE